MSFAQVPLLMKGKMSLVFNLNILMLKERDKIDIMKLKLGKMTNAELAE